MRALALADEVYLGAVNRGEKLGAAERFDPEAVAEQLVTQGIEAHTAATNEALLEKLLAGTGLRSAGTVGGPGRPRVVAFFTNGSFDGIIGRFVTTIGG
jgi:UDP-N-acetylmuramate: L-alanyl-gamma-D-glutamyl-meso-diaminopimelate ligase